MPSGPRRDKRNVAIDLKNAFGSVVHLGTGFPRARSEIKMCGFATETQNYDQTLAIER